MQTPITHVEYERLEWNPEIRQFQRVDGYRGDILQFLTVLEDGTETHVVAVVKNTFGDVGTIEEVMLHKLKHIDPATPITGVMEVVS